MSLGFQSSAEQLLSKTGFGRKHEDERMFLLFVIADCAGCKYAEAGKAGEAAAGMMENQQSVCSQLATDADLSPELKISWVNTQPADSQQHSVIALPMVQFCYMKNVPLLPEQCMHMPACEGTSI